MKNQKIRSMKVHEQSGYNYKATPTIILKGQWLKEMGFEIGDYISVSCEDGKLIITPDAEKATMAKAETEFMEKEMKKLQKRFQAEKEQLHAQFGAERSTESNGREVPYLWERLLVSVPRKVAWVKPRPHLIWRIP